MKQSLGISVMEIGPENIQAKGCTVIFVDDSSEIEKITDENGNILYEGGSM